MYSSAQRPSLFLCLPPPSPPCPNPSFVFCSEFAIPIPFSNSVLPRVCSGGHRSSSPCHLILGWYTPAQHLLPLLPSNGDRAPAWDTGNFFFPGPWEHPVTPSPCHRTKSQDLDMPLRYTFHGAMNESRDSVCMRPVRRSVCHGLTACQRGARPICSWGAACLPLLGGMMWSVPIWSGLGRARG